MFFKWLLKSVIDISIVQKTSLYRNTVLLFLLIPFNHHLFPLELSVLNAKFTSLLPGIKYRYVILLAFGMFLVSDAKIPDCAQLMSQSRLCATLACFPALCNGFLDTLSCPIRAQMIQS